MLSYTPSLDPEVSAVHQEQILSPTLRPELFHDHIRRLRSMFSAYVNACPPPWPAPGLAATSEDNYRSEHWLPISVIKPVFQSFCRSALRYPPVLSSCPLSGAVSWSAVVANLPPFCDCSADPSILLERLLYDDDFRLKFLCWAFMPQRFYGGGSNRYPCQMEFINGHLAKKRQRGEALRCLEVACGDGGGIYGLAALLLGQGWQPPQFLLEGWSLEPLEIWAAAHVRFPHYPDREKSYRNRVRPLFEQEAQRSILFRTQNLEEIEVSGDSPEESGYDLIICNGLLGGPLIHKRCRILTIVRNLSSLLRHDGLLLAADHFHAGWKRIVSSETLGEYFLECGLRVMEAGEGIGGFKGSQEIILSNSPPQWPVDTRRAMGYG